ncbi:MAG: hypothetical protein AAGI07_15060 [Bacteroidota bacterium]
MKKSLLSICTIISLLIASQNTWAQEDERDGSKNEEKIVIKINGDEHELGDYIAEIVEETVEKATSSFEANFDDNSFNFSFNFDEEGWDEWGENLGNSIENMVSNMDIELSDLDPEDFDDMHFDNEYGESKGSDLIKEIEKEHGSKVEKIEKMDIKLRKEKVIIAIKARLENGKLVEKRVEEERD